MIGTELEGRYRIEAELGAGGVGTVYRAVHLKLGRPVAIKILKPEFGSSADLRERFEREARALAALSHPNIVNVTDSGVAGDTPYLVMELLEGETLSERLRRGLLEPNEAIAVAKDLVAALSFVHEHGLVHRDVKPGNVFLQKVSVGRPLVRLLDFGLAKFLAPEAGGRVITRAGQIFGTPTYMAPEQVAGQEADARADIYAFGIILFEMLAGRPPFRGNWSELMRQHLMEELPSLESACPGRTATPALTALLSRATAKTRAERFQKVKEVGDALAALPTPAVIVGEGPASLAHEPTHLDPASARTRVEKPPAAPLPVPALPEPLDAVPSAPSDDGSALGVARDGSDRGPVGSADRGDPVSFFERFRVRTVRFVLSVLIVISLSGLLAAAAVVYILVTPDRARERGELDELLGFKPEHRPSPSPSPNPRASSSPPRPAGVPRRSSGDRVEARSPGTAALPPTADTVATEAPEAPEVASAPATASVAAAASEPSPEPSEEAPGMEPGAPPIAPLTETTNPVPPPATGPMPDPWSSIPHELVKLLAQANHGHPLDKKEILSVHRYNAKHPEDPRGHILLARAYLNRRWLKDSVNEYAIAVKVNPDARGDPRMVRDLLSIVEFGSSDAERLIHDTFGASAIAAADRALLTPQLTPEAKEHLEHLRASLSP